MSKSVTKSQTTGFAQATLTFGETGYWWFPVPSGKNVKIGVNDGHGCTYDVVVRLSPVGAVDTDGNTVLPLVHIESAGETGAYTAAFDAGLAQIGVNVTVAGTADMIVEIALGDV